MERIKIILFAAVLLSTISVECSETGRPLNTVTIVGSSVRLRCATVSNDCNGTEWSMFFEGHDTNPNLVYKYSGGIFNVYKDRYSVDNSSGCDLIIANVSKSDAGRFVCQKTTISKSTIQSSAFLIVLKSEPKCKTNASQDRTREGDGISLDCEVTYEGTLNFSITWKGKEDLPSKLTSQNGTTKSATASISAGSPGSYECVVSFDLGPMTKDIAPNTPTVTCKTPIISPLQNVAPPSKDFGMGYGILIGVAFCLFLVQ